MLGANCIAQDGRTAQHAQRAYAAGCRALTSSRIHPGSCPRLVFVSIASRFRDPHGVLISPGPCTPNEAGISLDLLRALGGDLPIFGVCLGHQAMGQAYGGRVVRAARLMHGRTSPILHDGRGVFDSIASPFEATRYHSLLVERDSLPACLEISAWTAEGEIMGLRHREHDVEGVQFHPESVLTREGKRLVGNWLARVAARAAAAAGGAGA